MWLDLQGHQDRRYVLNSALAELRETQVQSRQNSCPMLLFSLSSTIRLSCCPRPLLLMQDILKISFSTMIMPYLQDEGSFLLALPFRKQLMGTDLCVGIVLIGDYVIPLGP